MTTPDHSPSAKPVLLLVFDGIRPDVLRAAIREGDAPTLDVCCKVYAHNSLMRPWGRPKTRLT